MENTINITKKQANTLINNLFSNDSNFHINKTLYKHLKNLKASLLLTVLLEKESKERHLGIIKKGFFLRQQDIQKVTGLSPYHQRTSIKILEEKQIITVERAGAPATNYFTINHSRIQDILLQA